VWGPDRVLAQIDALSGNIYYYLYNGHGDVIQITDSSGNVVNSYDYDVWGNFLEKEETIDNPFTYFGQTYDEETGLYYLRARYYDPTTGRFTQQDPAEDGYNWYIYGNQNPVMFADYTGEMGVLATIAIGAGVGALVSAGFTLFSNIINGKTWTTGLGKSLLGGAVSGIVSGFISVLPIPGINQFVIAVVSNAAGELSGSMVIGEIKDIDDVAKALTMGVVGGIIGEGTAKILSSQVKVYFNSLTKANQKKFLSSIGKVTNAELKEIRKQLSNNITPDVLEKLADKYGYETIVSAFASSVFAEIVN